jgi:energy-coupling factor transporter ATP-binding protein EcfA2
MLTHLRLKNFKIWETTGPMRLAPVTLLLGTNSSGKSSIIQSLLLIRQTIKGGDPALDLNLGNPDAGDSVILGQFKDVLCRHGDSPRFEIEFRWSPTGLPEDSALFSAVYRKGPSGSAELEYLRLGGDKQSFAVQRAKPGIYKLWLGDERQSRRQSEDFRPQRSFAFSPAALMRLGKDADRIRDIGPQLLEELNRIIYLGPLRRLAQRDYVWNGRMPAAIGDDGSRAIDALIASGMALQGGKQQLDRPADAALIEQTGFWLKAMELADRLWVKPLGNSSRYELLVEHHGEQTNLRDVGVGVCQVLPVIVAALHAQAGDIVIVEEPESHLHPLAETTLADLFLTTSRKRKVQFIIETHSEHLFTRLQRRVAEAAVAPEEVALYFCNRADGQAILEPLRINLEGDIENWPENFFGDEMAEITARTVAAMERRQKGLTE